MRKFIAALFICIISLAGCSNEPAKVSSGDTIQGDENVIAKVGDKVIMDKDLEMILEQIPEQYRARYNSPEVRRDIIEKMVDVKILAWEAEHRGIPEQPDVQLKIDYLREQIIAGELKNKIVNEIELSDKDVKKFYDDNPEKFSTPMKIRARHILIKDNEAKAKELLARIKGGESFEAIAKEFSECPSGSKGGDLGWFSKGRMDPAFEKAAFALEKGQVSDVIKSSFGYHIIKLEDIQPAKTRDFEKVKASAEKMARQEKETTALDDVIEDVKKQISVEINDDYFKTPEAQEKSES